MGRTFIRLILFVFLALSAPVFAQEPEIYYLDHQPSGLKPNPKRYLPLEAWEMGNQSIRSNLELRLNTFPLTTKGKIQFDLGPGQILIRIPI